GHCDDPRRLAFLPFGCSGGNSKRVGVPCADRPETATTGSIDARTRTISRRLTRQLLQDQRQSCGIRFSRHHYQSGIECWHSHVPAKGETMGATKPANARIRLLRSVATAALGCVSIGLNTAVDALTLATLLL